MALVSQMRVFAAAGLFLALTACGPEPMTPFALRFAALVDGKEVGCTDELTGFGPGGQYTVGLSDLRFYVSNVRFADRSGKPIDLQLDSNEFQLTNDIGSVALIDLTGNTEGTCADSSIAFAEGTARTNPSISGQTRLSEVSSVSFDIGVPQPLMKQTIATNTAEGAPSPLNEMYWSWASGYRHFVLNLAVKNPSGTKGSGYVHVGSRDCGPKEGKALEDREQCTFVNTPQVTVSAFDLKKSSVGIDLRRILQDVDFISPIYDPTTFAVIGQGPGVECHSSPMQADCGQIFPRFGLDSATGAAAASGNEVFVAR